MMKLTSDIILVDIEILRSKELAKRLRFNRKWLDNVFSETDGLKIYDS